LEQIAAAADLDFATLGLLQRFQLTDDIARE